jgi:hypothetical protein
MSDEEGSHYTGYGHDSSTCAECREESKWDLARPLAEAMRDIANHGVMTGELVRMVAAIDAIIDEWPR